MTVSARILSSLLVVCFGILVIWLLLIRPMSVVQTDLSNHIQGELDKRVALEQRLQTLSSSDPKVQLREDLIWRSYVRSDAELAMQNEVISLSRVHNLNLSSFQTSALRDVSSHERIGFKVEGTSDLSSFYDFLDAVDQSKKKFAFASLLVRRSNQIDAQNEGIQISFRATMWAFWEAIP